MAQLTNQFFERLRSEGKLEVRFNEKVVIDRLSRDIYKGYLSGFREMVANSCRAVRSSSEPARGVITVTLDHVERKVVIDDNGCGITFADFEALLELGTTTNTDGHEAGQFGMGIASYGTMSTAIFIDSLAENGEGFVVVGRGGKIFDYFGESKRDCTGTTITMVVKDDVKIHAISMFARRIAMFCGVRMRLIETGNAAGDIDEFLDSSTPEEYIRNLHPDKPLFIIRHEGFELVATWATHTEPEQFLTILGMPAECDIDIGFKTFVLNITDERMFRPMPDRERLRPEALDVIQRAVRDELRSQVTREIPDGAQPPATYDELTGMQPLHRAMFCHRMWDNGNSDLDHMDLLEKAVFKAVVPNKMLWYNATLRNILGTFNNVAFARSSQTVHRRIFEETGHVIIYPTGAASAKTAAAIAKAWGLPTAAAVGRSIGIETPKRQKQQAGNYILHMSKHNKISSWMSKYEVPDLSGMNLDVISADTVKISDITKYLAQYTTDTVFVMHDTRARNDNRVVPYSKWLKRIGRIMVKTNKGMLPLSRIASLEKVVMMERPTGMEKNVPGWLTDYPDTVVIEDNPHDTALYLMMLMNPGLPNPSQMGTRRIRFLRFATRGLIMRPPIR